MLESLPADSAKRFVGAMRLSDEVTAGGCDAGANARRPRQTFVGAVRLSEVVAAGACNAGVAAG